MLIKHDFTENIIQILNDEYDGKGGEILALSPLVQYLNVKTKSASRGSKSRAGLANQYAIYVLVEDYVKQGFLDKQSYDQYEGARFSSLFQRQRELPFGGKLQNHALNHRLNEEFKRYFPALDILPVVRDVSSSRYWFAEKLLLVSIGGMRINISAGVLRIIEEFVKTRISSFNSFVKECERILNLEHENSRAAAGFIKNLIKPSADARIFEIVSYAILKNVYADSVIYWGWNKRDLTEERLELYKTGRTNANDGGIDFVMKPLGRFFQVTETVDAGKYFLDIDKVRHYPVTFVVKSDDDADCIVRKIRENAKDKYHIEEVVQSYMACIEEIINAPMLIRHFENVVSAGNLKNVVDEIILQSKLEFNIEEEISEFLSERNK